MRTAIGCLGLWLALVWVAWAQDYDQAMGLYKAGNYAAALRAFEGCAQTPEVRQWMGWCYLKEDRLDEAGAAFGWALERQSDHSEALTGMGYVELRREHPDQAVPYFEKVLAGHPDHADALLGLALARARQDRPQEARDLLARVLKLDPGSVEAREWWDKLANVETPGPVYPPRRPYQRAAQLQMPYRAGSQYFERDVDSTWQPFMLQGMNLGPALPGRWAGEPPMSRELYATWLKQMADMGCNVVRVYTILPPGFYQAFWDYHQDPANPPLWLVHGVWTELPVLDDYTAPTFQGEFQAEMHRVVELVHGQADIEPRTGHAYGHYTADVSPWVLAYLIGREWEPHSVVGFNQLHPGRTYTGTYISCTQGNPMEAWLAEMCDHMVAYEMTRYNSQRPISFTNWPTLDPLHHPTESTRAEEAGWMASRGEFDPRTTQEYDNDAVGITVKHFDRSPAFPAGLYGSYHAYPYYPEFMVVDPGYGQARSSFGPSHYFGYLLDLKRFYQGMPLIIAEYGVPSSRGDAHIQPEGFDHGGHSEQAQGEIDVRLTSEIAEAGCAGGMLFAWVDEWFKKNWMVIDMEIPLEHNQRWLNALDAEQNYGMIAARPGASGPGHTLTGAGADWGKPWCENPRSEPLHPLGDGHDQGRYLKALYFDHDEAYLYLRIDLGDAPDLARTRYLIGFDTYARSLGEHRLPTGQALTNGLEYLLEISGQGARLLVTPDYAPFGVVQYYGSDVQALAYRDQIGSKSSQSGTFVPIMVEPNRRRIGRDGTVFPARRLEWGKLTRGSLERSRSDWTTLADYNLNGSVLELRLPWMLLGITDPSTHRVIHDHWQEKSISTRVTDGICVAVASFGPDDQLVDVLPGPDGEGRLQACRPYLWPGWNTPTYHLEAKSAYGAMRQLFQTWQGRIP